MMFLQYFIWGAWGVVIFTFLLNSAPQGGLNFSGDLAGWIGATLPIGAMISPVFVGLFADRLFASEKVLAVLHLLGAALLGWAAWTCDQHQPQIKAAFDHAAAAQGLEPGSSLDKQAVEKINATPEVKAAVSQAFWPLFGLLLAYGLCYMPTLTLTNSLSFRNLSDPDKYFGGIRVLGTIGWIVAGWVVGFGLKDISAQPLYLAAAASVGLGLFSFFLPHTPPSGGAKTLGDTLGLPALAMLKERSFVVFFICSFLITIVLAFYFLLGNPFLTALHAPYPVALQTVGQISEIFFMLLIPVGLARVGTKGMLVIGMLAWCLRYAIFAWQNMPAIIFIGLPLHGICYDFFFVVAYLYVDRRAPKNLRASAQGMIGFVLLGLGMFLGFRAGGAVQGMFTEGNTTHWTEVWLVPLAGAAVATLLFAVLFREPRGDLGDVTMSKALEGLEPVEPPEQVR
jgi:nucleoside transporter